MEHLADGALTRLTAEVVTDVVFKATLLLGITGVATLLLRRASAATRHGVWSLALIALLLIPVLSLGLPAWYVDVPASVRSLLATDTVGEPSSEAAFSPDHRPLEEASVSAFTGVGASAGTTAFSQTRDVLPDAGQDAALPSEAPLGLPWSAWVMLVWSAGVAVLLGHLLLHMLRLWLVAQQAEVMADSLRAAEVVRLARRLGIRRRVRVLCSPEVSMAMTWGLWRPVVMFPYAARYWSEERFRVVLLHELAHVKRWDYLFHLVTQCVRALYWANPLVWVAARRVHVEQERACDDQVLQAGAGACDYATHLLDIARTFLRRTAPLPGGIAIVRGSTLSERVKAILNAGSNRHALSVKSGLLAAGMGLCLTLPVATMHPEPVVATTPDVSTPAPLFAQDPVRWRQAALLPKLQGEALAELLQHEDAEIRGRAAWALGERKEKQVVEPLLIALSDEDANVRWHAVTSLGKLEDRQALDPLDAMLDDPCPDVRAASVRALEKICHCHTLENVPVALADSDADVRIAAARVLGEAIRGLFDDDSPAARRSLRNHLQPAVLALIEALQDDNAVVRQHVAYALGEAGEGGAAEALKTAMRDTAAPVRLEAIRAIGKIDVSCATPALRLALDDPDADVREIAARVLEQFEAS